MEERSTELGRQKSVDLERGIFIVRYSAAEDEAAPPKIRIVPAPGSNAGVLPVRHPDAQEPVLWQPGSAMVVQVLEPGQLLVEATPTHPRGSAVATVRIETLSQGKPSVEITIRDGDQAQAAVAVKPNTSDFRVLGHVAGRGDVFVGADEWIGGPAAPARIEGLAIEWPNKPAGLTLRYAVSTSRPDAISNAPAEVGTFVGSRGRALPLLGFAIELSGSSASNYELVVEAAFLGSPVGRTRGQRLNLTGPTGREPLVGIRLKIEQVDAASQPNRQPAKSASTSQPAGRVRVFRSNKT